MGDRIVDGGVDLVRPSASHTAASPRSRTSSIRSPIERRRPASKMSSIPRRISAPRAATFMSFQTCLRITLTASTLTVMVRRCTGLIRRRVPPSTG
jgi:hypothetical protein